MDRRQHIGRVSRIAAGAEDEYRNVHRPDVVWPDLMRACSAAGFSNYNIFMRDRDLFAYFEVDDLQAASKKFAGDPVFDKWMRLIAPMMDAKDPLDPWQEMERVFFLP